MGPRKPIAVEGRAKATSSAKEVRIGRSTGLLSVRRRRTSLVVGSAAVSASATLLVCKVVLPEMAES